MNIMVWTKCDVKQRQPNEKLIGLQGKQVNIVVRLMWVAPATNAWASRLNLAATSASSKFVVSVTKSYEWHFKHKSGTQIKRIFSLLNHKSTMFK